MDPLKRAFVCASTSGDAVQKPVQVDEFPNRQPEGPPNAGKAHHHIVAICDLRMIL
jgi:hypothetical protein